MADAFQFFWASEQPNFIPAVIAIGLKNECQNMLPNKKEDVERLFNQYQDRIEAGLLQGLVKAKAKLKDPNLLLVLQQITEERVFAPTTTILLNFIKGNLLFAQRPET